MNCAFFDVDQTILEGFSGSDMCRHFEEIGVFPAGFTEWYDSTGDIAVLEGVTYGFRHEPVI